MYDIAIDIAKYVYRIYANIRPLNYSITQYQ
jgi:hypothetical protein